MGTKVFYQTVISNASDTTFRAWGQQLSNAIATAGLVRTADSGQVNWATVTAPVGANTMAGYEIYRFNDALQSTAPIFIKMEYGCGTAVGHPQVWITVGTGTNGAGTITGLASARFAKTTTGTTASTVNTYVCNPGGSTFVLVLGAGSNINCHNAIVVDRTRDANGAATDDGLYMLYAMAASTTSNEIHNRKTVQKKTAAFPVGCLMSTAWGLSAYGTNVQVFPHYAYLPQPFNVLACGSYWDAEMPQFSEASLALIGSTPRNYLFTGPTGFGTSNNSAVVGNASMCVLWED
jgi:hypothetical protein